MRSNDRNGNRNREWNTSIDKKNSESSNGDKGLFKRDVEEESSRSFIVLTEKIAGMDPRGRSKRQRVV